MIDFKMVTKGTILEGRTGPAMKKFIERATEAIGEEAVNDVKSATRVFKRPTGAYVRGIQTRRQIDSVLITERVIYGPWIEGTSSRNRRSRFKGYSIFRKTKQALQRKASRIAERELPRTIRELER